MVNPDIMRRVGMFNREGKGRRVKRGWGRGMFIYKCICNSPKRMMPTITNPAVVRRELFRALLMAEGRQNIIRWMYR